MTDLKSAPSATNQATALDLLFHLYLFGRKIKFQAKQIHSEHVHDQMLEFGILRLIAEKSKSVSELAEVLSTGLSAMSERIKTLKDKGLVDQITGGDAREMRCRLTEAGHAFITEAKSKMSKACFSFTNTLSETEIAQLNILIKKLIFTSQDK